MNKKFQALILFCIIALIISCEQKNSEDTSNNTEAAEAVKEESAGNIFGEPVDVNAAISLASLEAEIGDRLAWENITVTGKVTEVCQKKGCWMKLMKDNGEAMRVTFKDYALFMPTDITVKEVVLRGKAYSDTVTVDVLRHFAEDAGKSQAEIEAITEPEIALAFEADGVIIEE
jgi:hypothetical protein